MMISHYFYWSLISRLWLIIVIKIIIIIIIIIIVITIITIITIIITIILHTNQIETVRERN